MQNVEIRPGYKLTEVGIIPEDWEIKPLGELASVTAGGTPSRTNLKYWNGNIPWVTTSEVDFCTIGHAEQFITKEGLNNSAAKLLPRGTLLMALYGQGKTRGKVGILGIEATTNQACAAILLKQGVSSDFIFHFLISQYDAIRNLSNTGNQENLNNSLVRSIPILLPPLPEQRSLATVLSDMDELLGALEHLIAKKRDLKQAAMQQLLTGKTRLPGFGKGKGYKQTEVGEIPEDWEVKKLESVVSYKNGAAHEQRINDSGKFVVVNSKFISTEGLTRKYSDDCFCPAVKNDVLMVMSDVPNGKAIAKCFWVENNNTYTVNQRICVLSPRNINGKLLFYKLDRNPFYLEFDDGVKQTNLRKSEVLFCLLGLPKLEEEQTAIATILSDMDTEIAAIEQRRDKTRALKQAMMQELLTGRIRLV